MQKKQLPTDIEKDSSLSPYWDEAKMISMFHQALDQYNVMVWNGAPTPTEKPIGKAIFYISEQVKDINSQVKENSELLSGVRSRKRILSPLYEFVINLEGATKKSKFIRVLLLFAAATTSIMGIISVIQKIFF